MTTSDHLDGRGGLEAADLLDEFERWAADHDVDVDPFVVDAALDWRVSEDGDLVRWNAEDVRELLTEWFPRKVTLSRSEWQGVLSTLHHWVDFLAAAPTGGTVDPPALHAAIEEDAQAFLAGMADERNYGLAKFWTTRMIEHGVDPQDEGDVRRFVAAAQAGEVEYDQGVLDEIMRRRAFDAGLDLDELGLDEDEGRPLPPVLLPADHELAASAARTALVARFRVLSTWVGEGRALTATKRLRLADARELAGLLGVDQPYLERARGSADLPEVSLLVAWAKAARLVRVVKARLVPVRSAAGLLDRPLDLWKRAHEVLPRLGPAVCMPTSRYEGPSPLGQVLPEVAPELWLCLYTAGGTPMPVELLVRVMRDALNARFDFGVGGFVVDFRDLMLRRDLDGLLAALEVLGAVDLRVAADAAERDKIVELSGDEDPDLALVNLTPLGLWAAREALVEEGFEAPLAGELVSRPLERVCEALRHAAPDLAESVMTEWVGVRPSAEAAAELAAFCVDGPSPSARLLAWTGLEHTGEPGVEQARRLRSVGGIPGAMATEWLVRHHELAPDAAQEHEMVLALVESLAAVHEYDLLIEELTRHSLEDQVDFVRALALTDHPDRRDMLATLADRHPEKEVVVAARTALGTLTEKAASRSSV